MKKFHIYIISACLILVLSGCAIFSGSKNKNQAKIDTKLNKIEKTETGLVNNNDVRNKNIQSMSSGVDAALTHIVTTNAAVNLARELNLRVMNLAGTPNFVEYMQVRTMVSNLLSQVESTRLDGEKSLAKRDAEIFSLQSERDGLKTKLEQQQKELGVAADLMAKNADVNQGKIDDMNRFFGLGAVFYGIKRFFLSSLTIIVVFSIIFLILRILSNTNPIAKAAFSIFELIGSMGLKLIKGLSPGAFKMENFVSGTEHAPFKNIVYKIVDSMEEMKSHANLKDEKYTLDDILVKFSKAFDDSEKKLVKQCKEELKW
jgi:hypothetical protein